LKAFKRVNVNSVYRDEGGKPKSRTFMFTASEGVSQERNGDAPSGRETSTCVHLDGFEKRYREASFKTTGTIASSMFEHCLWYFVRPESAPNMVVIDGDKHIDLQDVYHEHMISSAERETIAVKKEDFDLTHIKLRASSSQSHAIVLCAAKRLVREENVEGKIPGLYGKLSDRDGDFVYKCYVASPFLDEIVRSERTEFDLPEDYGEVFAKTEISMNEIREAVIRRVSVYLSEYLEDNKRRAEDRIESFVAQKAPRYRPILSRIPKDRLHNIDPDISDKDLDLTLHRQYAEIEETLLREGHDIMNPRADEDFPEYQKRLQEYMERVEDIKKSDLVNYVSHRRVILALLEKAIQMGRDGDYTREDMIHNLVMPMHHDSNEVMPDSCNLWLIDERLAFHNYLASDKTLASMPITGSTDAKKPDICALNVFDNPILVSVGDKLPLASIVVIEIKRPMRNDATEGEERDPIEQALGYLERIRQGKVLTARGRGIPNSDSIPGFCYVVCDITPSVEKRCKMHDAIRTKDGLGYFFYHKNYSAYVEVMSFDGLVNAAKDRNKAFFDKLGFPTT
jgi:hypothetical protein